MPIPSELRTIQRVLAEMRVAQNDALLQALRANQRMEDLMAELKAIEASRPPTPEVT